MIEMKTTNIWLATSILLLTVGTAAARIVMNINAYYAIKSGILVMRGGTEER
jgi:hypothetical protein